MQLRAPNRVVHLDKEHLVAHPKHARMLCDEGSNGCFPSRNRLSLVEATTEPGKPGPRFQEYVFEIFE